MEALFANSGLANLTIKKYLGALGRLENVDDPEDVIQHIMETYTNVNTIKVYLSAVMAYYKLSKMMEEYDKVYAVFKEVRQGEEAIEKPTKPINDAITMLTGLRKTYEELKNNLTETYDINRQNTSIAKLFIDVGVMRGAELISFYIDDDKQDNYFDLKKKQLIIRNHKTMKKSGTRVIDLSDDFIELIRDFPNRPFVTNTSGEPYKDATGLNKRLTKVFGEGIYDIRKARVSENLKGFDADLAKKQGHTVDTQLKSYRKYI